MNECKAFRVMFVISPLIKVSGQSPMFVRSQNKRKSSFSACRGNQPILESRYREKVVVTISQGNELTPLLFNFCCSRYPAAATEAHTGQIYR
jgi:hypothetical protein